MIERGRRFIIWLAMAAFSLALLFEGHGVSPEDDAVSFFEETPSGHAGVLVRVSGNIEKPGIYRLAAGTGIDGVIIMTLSGDGAINSGSHHVSPPLRSGEVVEIFEEGDKTDGITRKEMGAEEKLLLGIPLDLNRMSQSDWEYLPGIGVGIAKKLVEYRQKYGDFASLKDLDRVPGIGNTRLKKIGGYFSNPN